MSAEKPMIGAVGYDPFRPYKGTPRELLIRLLADAERGAKEIRDEIDRQERETSQLMQRMMDRYNKSVEGATPPIQESATAAVPLK